MPLLVSSTILPFSSMVATTPLSRSVENTSTSTGFGWPNLQQRLTAW